MILAGLSMAEASCTGSVWPGARLAWPGWHGPRAVPAAGGRTTCRTGGPLNTPRLLCVLVVDGGISGAPWRSRSAGLSRNSEDTDVCSPRPGTASAGHGPDRAGGGRVGPGHLGRSRRRARRCAAPPTPGHEPPQANNGRRRTVEMTDGHQGQQRPLQAAAGSRERPVLPTGALGRTGRLAMLPLRHAARTRRGRQPAVPGRCRPGRRPDRRAGVRDPGRAQGRGGEAGPGDVGVRGGDAGGGRGAVPVRAAAAHRRGAGHARRGRPPGGRRRPRRRLRAGLAGAAGGLPTTSRPRRPRSARCTAGNGGPTAARSSRWP